MQHDNSVKARFQRDGYALIPDFASADEVAQLRQQTFKLLEEFDPKNVSVFSTQSHMQGKDEYFLRSGDKISFFFEEHAFNSDGTLKQEKAKSINKIGHALHEHDPVFGGFTRSEKMRQLARELDVEQPLIVQSMVITKQPRIGGVVRPHQDSTFLFTEPCSTVGFWIALEDCSTTNGCLWAWPGSHRQPLVRRWKLSEDGQRTYFDPPQPPGHVEFGEHLSKFVPLDVKSGTMVVLHGHLVHWSDENRSSVSRLAYTFHLISAKSNYPKDNWLQRPTAFTPL